MKRNYIIVRINKKYKKETRMEFNLIFNQPFGEYNPKAEIFKAASNMNIITK